MTFLLLGAGFVLVIAASLGDRARRGAPFAWHAYVPWHAAIFAGAVAVLFAAVHLLTLARA